MADLTTDSPLSRRIVRSFLDFLKHVKPSPGVDLEGIEVARECLAEAFKLDPSYTDDDRVNPNELVTIFRSLEGREQRQQREIRSDNGAVSVDALSTSSAPNTSGSSLSATERTPGEDWTREAQSLGISKDELLGQFFATLEKIHFFKATPDGKDDQAQLDRAAHLFHCALTEMEISGCQKFDQENLAEALKSQGNKAMQSKLYLDAIELYSIAVALSENNAVYYCNRAAAYTQIHRYNEAIRDCQRSIEIDPHYSKAYSRLGFAYYAQGNYIGAISEGFVKALQLDPNNDAVKENIRMAEQKLKEELQRTEHSQTSGSSSQNNPASGTWSAGGPGASSGTTAPQFTSMAFDTGTLPGDLRNMFANMAANACQGQHSQDQPEDGGGRANDSNQPGIRIGGNVSMNFGEQQMPEEITGALRSVMEMFSGAASHGNPPQNGTNGRPAPS